MGTGWRWAVVMVTQHCEHTWCCTLNVCFEIHPVNRGPAALKVKQAEVGRGCEKGAFMCWVWWQKPVIPVFGTEAGE